MTLSYALLCCMEDIVHEEILANGKNLGNRIFVAQATSSDCCNCDIRTAS